MELKIYNLALKDFDAAGMILPGDIRLHQTRGYLFAQMKSFGEAMQEYRKALEIEPANRKP